MTVAALDVREEAGRPEIVRLARAWIGTPYEHQASCRGAGADCLGLVRGLWRELFGFEPETVPAYTPDWSEARGSEDLLAASARHMAPVPAASMRCGDVIVLRMRRASVAKHLGILAEGPARHPTLIHAYSGHGVVESPFTPSWRRRVAGAFRFPDRRT